MRSDRTRLTGNFNTKPKSYLTPNRKQPTSLKSPSSMSYQSPTKSSKVEKIMCLKEDEFLNELQQFHQEVSEYEEKKNQLSTNSAKLAKDSISLLSLASNLSVYQQKLEQRANFAHEILSDPIDDLSSEIKLVEQLEKDVEVYKNKLPQLPSEEERQEIEDKLREAQHIQNQNLFRSQQLEKRKTFLEIESKQIDLEMSKYQELLKEDQNNAKKSEDEDLESAFPDENESSKENIRQLKQKKEELEQKRITLNQKKSDLDEFEKQIETEKEQHKKELDELQKTLNKLKETKSSVDKKEIDLNEIAGIKAQLEIDRDDINLKLNRMKRLFEAQKEELGKVEKKRAEISRRKDEIEGKKKEIEEKTLSIAQKRESLKKSEDEYNSFVDELDDAKRQLAEKQARLEKQQKILKSYQEKIRQLNDGNDPSDFNEIIDNEQTAEKNEPEKQNDTSTVGEKQDDQKNDGN